VHQNNHGKNSRKRADHRVVRNDTIEITTGCRAPARQGGHKDDSNHNGPSCANRPEARPGILLIGAGADFRQDLRYIDGKLMRRRILASEVTLGAVVAKIRQVIHVGIGER